MFMPLVHRNSLSFIGMGSKQGYLVWLECEGEFTALDRAGVLHTWSTVTGMKLRARPGAVGRPDVACAFAQAPGGAQAVAVLADYELYG